MFKFKDKILKIFKLHNDITELYSRTDHLIEIVSTIFNYIGEVPVRCDKCLNTEDEEALCFKCENTGVVKHKQLFNWPQ